MLRFDLSKMLFALLCSAGSQAGMMSLSEMAPAWVSKSALLRIPFKHLSQ
jgi:hypothetical protein